MTTRPRLPSLWLALALIAPHPAFAQSAIAQGDCSTGFAQVIVIGQVKIDNRCGLPEAVVNEIRDSLLRVQRDQNLSLTQMQSLASATNIMLGTVINRLGRIESKVDAGIKQAKRDHKLSRQEAKASFDELGKNLRKQIEEGFAAQLKANPNTDIVQEAHKWEEKYNELLRDWNVVSGDDPRDEEVRQALEHFDLNKAGRLLDALIEAQGKTEKVLAARQWRRAQVYLLQFDRLKAMPHLRKAFALDADNTDYGIQLGKALQEQHDYLGAEPVYRELVSHLRALARDNPAAYRPNLATSLNNLGLLYADTQRFKEAEAAHAEAVDIRRTLARDNPAAYRPDLANSLNNLGGLYFRTQRLKEAETPFAEAVSLQRALYQTYPAAHGPNLKVFLSNLAELYAKQNRPNDQAALETEIAAVDKKLAQSTTK